ncbi:hypothetical protein [uncultured Planktosalinus sp.]|uniref:hypothetical protein n=1 Tax=uncultured Planktosalinus sp. TaxID=1810935 RepID=UPI0030D6F13A
MSDNKSELNESNKLPQTSRSVEEVFEIWAKSLGDRLKIDEKTITHIKNIYLDAYISSGGNLDDNLNREEAQLLRNQIVKETKDEVIKLLNTDQQNIYLRFIKD